MSITDIIALLAFIVALYGAILSTYTAINEFFRLRLFAINQSENFITLSQNDYYQNDYGVHISTFNKNLYTIAILVRLTNKSKNLTTINEISLNNKYVINSASSFDNYLPTSFKYNKTYLIYHDTKYLKYPIIKPLLEIKPLTSYEGYLIFNNIEEIPSKFNITINTVQKSKTFNLKVSIANDYRNSIIQERL